MRTWLCMETFVSGLGSKGKKVLDLATDSAEHDALIDPKPKWYTAPDAAETPDSASSHGMMLDLIGTDKRVVEFGCASGYMSRWLVGAGCRVTGVEVDAAMAAEARGICDEVVVADLDTRRVVDLLPGSAFDIAVFGDVLEHLRDPWRVLDETRSLLGDGGSVVISIPNVAHGNVRLALLRGSFEYQELGLLDNTHLRFFTAKTVRELCMRAGYRIERMERTKAALFAATDTMPKLDPSDFDPNLIAEIQRDPEHDTFQFIIRAVPLTDEQRLDTLVDLQAESSDRLAETSVRLDRALARIETFETELAELRQRVEMQNEREFLLIERSADADRAALESVSLRERVVICEGEIQRLEVAIDSEQQEADRNVQRLELAIESEQLKTRETDEALRETVALFLTHANSELEVVRAEISAVDRAIAKIQQSRFWSMKLGLGKLKARSRRSSG